MEVRWQDRDPPLAVVLIGGAAMFFALAVVAHPGDDEDQPASTSSSTIDAPSRGNVVVRRDRGRVYTGQNADAAWLTAIDSPPVGDTSLEVRPIVDSPEDPNWSCTLAALAEFRGCVLDGDEEREPNAPRERSAEAKTLIEDLCARAAPDDAVAVCLAGLAPAQDRCSAPRRSSVLDGRGRFRASGADCLDAVRGNLDTVFRLLQDHRSCCRCLARQGETKAAAIDAAASQCLMGIVKQQLPDDVDHPGCDSRCAAMHLEMAPPPPRRRLEGGAR